MWRSDANQIWDFTAYIHVVGEDGRAIAMSDEVPTIHRFPPRLWRNGDVVIDHRTISIPAGTPAGIYTLQFGSYSPSPDQPVSLYPAGTDKAAAQNRVDIAEVAILPEITAIPEEAQAVQTDFGHSIRLLSILGSNRLSADRQLPITLFWSATRPVEHDYSVSVQILSADGALMAQQDGPLGGALPTSRWPLGDTISDVHLLKVPVSVPANVYTLAVIVYDPVSGERLSPSDNAPDNTLRLREVFIE
jgi:hypothetical protein